MPRGTDTTVSAVNLLQLLNQFGLDRAQETGGPLREELLNFLMAGRGLSPEIFELLGEMQGLPGQFGEMYQPQGAVGENLPLLQQMVQGGGWTPRAEEGFGSLLRLARGQGGAFQSEPENVALETLGGRGRNANLMQLAQYFPGIMGNQGVNADIRRAQEAGFGTVESGGMTPALEQIAQQTGSIIGGGPGVLLPMDQVQGFARERATTAGRQQAEGAIRRALALGGGPGSRMSGTQFRGLADFADQLAQGESEAVMGATLGQQGLQLQQLQAALQGGVGAQDVAARRFGAGADILNQAQGAALGRFQAGGQLGLGVEGQTGTNLRDAMSALDSMLRGRVSAGEGARGFAGLDIQNLGNALQALTSLTGQSTQSGGDMLRALLSLTGQRGDILSRGPTNFLQAADILGGRLVSPYLGYAGSSISPMAGVYGQAIQEQFQPGFWQQIAQAGLGAAARAAGNRLGSGGIPIPIRGGSGPPPHPYGGGG